MYESAALRRDLRRLPRAPPGLHRRPGGKEGNPPDETTNSVNIGAKATTAAALLRFAEVRKALQGDDPERAGAPPQSRLSQLARLRAGRYAGKDRRIARLAPHLHRDVLSNILHRLSPS